MKLQVIKQENHQLEATSNVCFRKKKKTTIGLAVLFKKFSRVNKVLFNI